MNWIFVAIGTISAIDKMSFISQNCVIYASLLGLAASQANPL
jgi:hypothetical protein